MLDEAIYARNKKKREHAADDGEVSRAATTPKKLSRISKTQGDKPDLGEDTSIAYAVVDNTDMHDERQEDQLEEGEIAPKKFDV